MSQAPSDMVAGAVILGRYELMSLLGEGGMGTVFAAWDRELRRHCALKVLQVKYTGDARAHQRFLREAEFAAGLDDRHVVRVFDRGVLRDDAPFYTMELLRGETLAETISRERWLPWPRTRHIAIQLCRVLSLIHSRGIVHRDLKPENCFLVRSDDDGDFVKLLDFGIAKEIAGGNPQLTETSEVVGTALYMSPEQACGDRVDHRGDVFAAGVIFYQLLGGLHPFARANALKVLQAILKDTPPELCALNPAVPLAVEAVVAKAMAKRIELRYASAEELLRALEAVPADAPASDPAQEVQARGPHVHTPSTLALTEAAGSPATVDRVEAVEPGEDAGERDDREAAPMLALSDQQTGLFGSRPSARRRILVLWVTLTGMLGVASALVISRCDYVSVVVDKPSTPVSEPAAVAPLMVNAPPPARAGERNPVVDPHEEDVPAPEQRPPKPVQGPVNKKPTAAPGPRSQAEFIRGVDQWRVGIEKKPPGKCAEIRGFRKVLQFTAEIEKARPILRPVKVPNDIGLCADRLAVEFSAKFRGWKVVADATHTFTVTYGG